jgi:Holliday junction resolvase
MNNKKSGNDFEQEFCELLAKNGFWAHNMANRKNGQPADVIAVRNSVAYLIDCKVCEGDRFDFKRAEENQRLAMERWFNCGNGSGWFALKFDDDIYMIDFFMLEKMEKENKKSINKAKADWALYTFKEWLEVVVA